MNYKLMIKMTVITFAMIFSFCITAFAQQANDLAEDDKTLVLAVYEKLKPDFDAQLNHINVRADASDGVVILEGWVVKKADLKKITNLIKKMSGVNCVVIAKLSVGKGVGCGPGQQECGGSCISSKDACTVCLQPGKCT